VAATSLNVDVRHRPHERSDLWWVEPLVIVIVLGAFGAYSFFAGVANANYYYEPYLSPLYSPCLSANCVHPTLPIVGSYWNLSPAILILAFPLAFRVTCYYYRRSYYRAFFWAPPACVVPDIGKRYAGETRFPFLIQNLHRYALIFATALLVFLWWDVVLAFDFDGRFGIGLGTILLLANVILLSGYSASCHSLRYLVGGHLDSFHGKSLRYRLWSWANALNARHARWAWASLVVVAGTDLYIRLLSMGVLTDPRWIP
jgi:hypothetical protein